MENGEFLILSILYNVVMMLLLLRVTLGEPRAQIVEITCTNQQIINTTEYVRNFVASMESIRTQIETQGYGIATTGQGPDAYYNLAQCYGDLSLVDCVLCHSQARTFITQCNPFNGARLFLDGCFMRAWNVNFFQEYTGQKDRVVCGNRTRKNSAFQETVRRAVLQAASYAPNNNGYARAEMPVSGTRNESAYVLANCWRTLNDNSCKACLENASTSMLRCLPWSESRALNTGCFMRYSDTNFLNPIPSNGSSNSKRNSMFTLFMSFGVLSLIFNHLLLFRFHDLISYNDILLGTPTIIIAVVVSSAFVVAGVVVIGVYIWKHRRVKKKRKGFYDVKKLAKTLRDSSLNFKCSTLEKATSGFDEANKLGQGGFGTVYKGVLSDGREIAVKRLFCNNMQRVASFYNEVNIISCVEHKNLVRLLGCSCSGPENLLVYEYLPNKSLDCFIFDSNEGKKLNWEKRFAIIIGTAEGLVYLHENTKIRIIHRDIKASNILLDTRFRAKVADFGLARFFQEDKSHIITGIVGTLGYMAPEYLSHGQLTEKADVYSFGVLLLEIVTGIQNNGSKISEEYSKSLLTIAWKHFQQRTVEELIDPNLIFHNDHTIRVKYEVLRVVHVGLLCTQEIAALRPSMSKALQMLTMKDEHLPPPTKPPFTDEKSMEHNGTFENSSNALISGNFNSVVTISQSIFYPR